MIDPLEFAVEIAQQAGCQLAESFALFGTKALLKGDNSLVTQADLDADNLISTAIRSQFPQDLLLSEESSTNSGDIGKPIWIVDPLDGTTNFSLGLPIWGVSIARIVNGLPQLGVLFFPLLNELYTAAAGQGAALNQIPLSNTTPPHHHTSFFACCTRTARYYSVELPYKTRILGSAAYHLCCVARGAAIMSLEVTPKLWDLAAGWLIVQEAGCEIDVLEGPAPFPLLPGFDYKSLSFPTISAREKVSFANLRGAIQKK